MRIGLATSAVLLFGGFADSAAGLELVKVDDQAYAIVGDLGQRSPANLGNNSTHGFIVTGAGIVLIDPGATRAGAAQIERAIRRVSEKPIVAVVNTGGQDHRWLANGYFKERGAQIIATRAAVADQKRRFQEQRSALAMLVGAEAVSGLVPVFADTVIDAPRTFTFGEADIEVIPSGGAHTDGDAMVWWPARKIMFSGDVVYVRRLLAVLPVSHSGNWLAAFDKIEALAPRVIVPGHGPPADLATARRHTRDYLRHLRTVARGALEARRILQDTLNADQSAFSGLVGFDQLARRNLQQVYMELEFE